MCVDKKIVLETFSSEQFDDFVCPLFTFVKWFKRTKNPDDR